MCIRNVNPKVGLCNGTRLRLTRLHRHFVQGEILTGDAAGTFVAIPKINLVPNSNDESQAFEFRRVQLPLKLSFAMTINKSQGQSFRRVGLDLRQGVFTHGQLYVLSTKESFGSFNTFS